MEVSNISLSHYSIRLTGFCTVRAQPSCHFQRRRHGYRRKPAPGCGRSIMEARTGDKPCPGPQNTSNQYKPISRHLRIKGLPNRGCQPTRPPLQHVKHTIRAATPGRKDRLTHCIPHAQPSCHQHHVVHPDTKGRHQKPATGWEQPVVVRISGCDKPCPGPQSTPKP